MCGIKDKFVVYKSRVLIFSRSPIHKLEITTLLKIIEFGFQKKQQQLKIIFAGSAFGLAKVSICILVRSFALHTQAVTYISSFLPRTPPRLTARLFNFFDIYQNFSYYLAIPHMAVAFSLVSVEASNLSLSSSVVPLQSMLSSIQRE